MRTFNLLLLLVLLAAETLCAAPPPAAPSSPVAGTASGESASSSIIGSRLPALPATLKWRRVYFPEGTKAWTKSGEKYLPIEAAEFERLIEETQRTVPAAPGQTPFGLVEAQYDCRLTGQSLLAGSARLDVSPSVPSAMLMTLDPCNLAISRAQWITSDGAPAVLGLTGDGKLQMLAERAGQMKFDWSLAGQPDAAGGVVFAIGLPPSPVSRIRLDLPNELKPAVDHGFVIDGGPAPPSSRNDSGAAGLSSNQVWPSNQVWHRWDLELGGRSGCRLRVAKAGSEEARPKTVLARESSTYEFSLRGVELTVNLNIESHREPLPNVVVGLDPALDLVEVSSDDEVLSWNRSKGRDGKVRQITIGLPPSRQQGAAHLRLRAIAPLVTGASWKLPRISFRDVVSRSNTIRLAVPAPLCLDHLQTRGCRQSGVGRLARSAGEQFDFETFAADAEIEVLLAQRPAEVRAVSATATVLGQGKMSSRVAADFRTGEGSVFTVDAEVLPNWTIDSVESQPSDALDDWTLAIAQSHQVGRGAMRTLSIRLARPLTPDRPLRLIVLARRLYATPGRNLGINDLVPLRFVGLAQRKRWVDLRASGSNELHFTAGDHLRRADLKEITAAELDLFAQSLLFKESAPGDFLFRDDSGKTDLRLSLESRRPTYSAAIRSEAVIGDGLLTENYSIACTPSKAAPIDRVLVHFAGHREGPLRWLAAGIDESRFTARRWSAQEEAGAGLTPDEENWEVAFRSPRPARLAASQNNLVCRAARVTRLAGPTPVCLASLPDAARQEGVLIVRCLGPQVVEMKTRRLTAQPAEAAPAGQVQTVRASYRYDPRTEGAPQPEAALVLTAAEHESAAAWVWDCELRSQVAANGAADHVVSYRIQNTGSRRVRLTLPAPLARRDVHGIWVNDKPVAVNGTDSGESVLNIDLPADLKFATLVVQMSTGGAHFGAWNRVVPPLPDIGLPVFAQRWKLELPPGYALCGYSGAMPDSAAPFNISRSLLGILGRGQDQAPFNPLRGEDWQSLFRGWHTENSPVETGSAATKNPAGSPAANTAGWTQISLDLARGDSSVIVVRRAAVDAASWVVFLAIVGIGAWHQFSLSANAANRPRVAAISCSTYGSDPRAMLIFAVILGIPALLLPAAISVIFSHGLLGVIFCLLLGFVRHVSRRAGIAGEPASTPRNEIPSTLTNVLPFGAPLLAFAMLFGCPFPLLANAATEAAETTPPSPPVYSVFIPVDDKQQPTQGKCFLPEPLFDELYRRAAVQTEKPQGWMIASAVYRASLADDATQSGHVVDRLLAEFKIHVFNAAARVRIPLRRDEASLEPGQAKLDARAVQPEWEPDGTALLLEIAEPGEYRLELTLRPTSASSGRSGRIDLAIPRVPAARLEFSVPTPPAFPDSAKGELIKAGAAAGQVEFPSALGEVRWEEAQSRWIAEIGPANRLSIRWPEDAPEGDAEGIDVEQLLWLKIEPGCVLLDVRIKAKAAAPGAAADRSYSGRASAGRTLGRPLLVRADSALELLPSPPLVDQSGTGAAPNVQPLVHNTADKTERGTGTPQNSPLLPVPVDTLGSQDGSQTYEIQWPQPAGSMLAGSSTGSTVASAASFDLHFRWSGVSSLGTFRLPPIAVVGARPVRRSLAVSVDPAIEPLFSVAKSGLPAAAPINPGKAQSENTMRVQESEAVAAFLANWAAGDAQPEPAYRLNGNASTGTGNKDDLSTVPPPRPVAAWDITDERREWNLTTRVRRTETSGDQNVAWSFSAQSAIRSSAGTGTWQRGAFLPVPVQEGQMARADVQLNAQLTTAGSLYQYRLEAPPALHVDSIAVLADGGNLAARWSQAADGRITVFLASPVSGRHAFHLHGQLPLRLNRATALPQFRLDDVRLQNSRVSLYRRPDVLVEIAGDRHRQEAPPLPSAGAPSAIQQQMERADAASSNLIEGGPPLDASFAGGKTGPAKAGQPSVTSELATDEAGRSSSAIQQNMERTDTDRGRLLHSFYVDSADVSPLLVTVKANRPRVSAEQVTRPACEDNRWHTTCEYSLHVTEGLLDAIELDVPASWKDNVPISAILISGSPAMPTTFAAPASPEGPLLPPAQAEGDDRATLVLSPSAAISGDFAFSISGPTAAVAAEPPQAEPPQAGPPQGFPCPCPWAVPNIIMKHVQSAKQYVVLPQYLRRENPAADNRPLDWALQKLRRCTPKPDSKERKDGAQPTDPPALIELERGTLRYEVTGKLWQAVLLPPRKTTAAARVLKSDVRYAWQSDGRCLGAAFLDVETAGAIDCPLELPDGFELLQLTVDGLPVDAVKGEKPVSNLSASGWSVHLASVAAASRVELLFFAPVPQMKTGAIGPFRSGWAARPLFDKVEIGFRAPKLGDLPVERTTWTLAAPPSLQLATAAGPGAPADLGHSEKGQTPPDSPGGFPADEIDLRWQKFVEEGRMLVFSDANGSADMIAVDYRPVPSQSWLPRLSGIAGFLAAMGLAALVIRSARASVLIVKERGPLRSHERTAGILWNWFVRRPYLVGIGIGLAWWLWLSPSAVGMIIVAAVLFAHSLRRRQKRLPWRRLPRPV